MEEREELFVVVETWFSGKLASTKTINHNDRDDRVWLGKHCYWAFRNDREIRTHAKKD